MHHRRLKQNHWSNTKYSSENLNSLPVEANSTLCHITKSSRTNSTEENFTTTDVSSKLQQQENFSSNLHFKQHSEDEEEEFHITTTSHCNVSQSSPYLFHFLVLVLLTFAQFAGKKTHIFLLIQIYVKET